MLELVGAVSKWAIPVFLAVVLIAGAIRGVRVFEAFVEGAEQGFGMAVKIIPYLVAMVVAISVFRASGAMDCFVGLISPLLTFVGAPPEILPHALMRPLSGGAALGIATELIEKHGPDSFIGLLVSTMQGSTDTTFYILTLYFGAVGVKRYRYAVASGLTADLTTLLASIFIAGIVFRG
ncbi:spore maturation protein [Candidatus Desulforudis audaxviator]|uniref:Nucleoside recognition domain protein n=1 Tax=Desulforudis audaxviator (strain MP104C) TaxID=477974 RepID=B1I3X7_DESAP|nr:nucleoside recognition domain-containing protein [Candidatus Desulforudis audaxviator]ACA59708.1 nucleoside recognition domain protein [Candidatus Desulforudis audaxviator MP104C]AZK59701.1 Spore maturation protein B [Candidatus Desulforudis audaxviator]